MRIPRFMQLIALPSSFVLLATFAAAQIPSASLDIVGIKPGMAANDAMQALKADNARLKLTRIELQLEGFTGPLTPLVQGDDIAPNNVAEVNQASETVQVLLTTPPGPA